MTQCFIRTNQLRPTSPQGRISQKSSLVGPAGSIEKYCETH